MMCDRDAGEERAEGCGHGVGREIHFAAAMLVIQLLHPSRVPAQVEKALDALRHASGSPSRGITSLRGR